VKLLEGTVVSLKILLHLNIMNVSQGLQVNRFIRTITGICCPSTEYGNAC